MEKNISIFELVWTYRKWKNTKEVFYIESEYDWDYYCEAPYYEDSWYFESDYVLKESEEASMVDILKYKAESLLYKI